MERSTRPSAICDRALPKSARASRHVGPGRDGSKSMIPIAVHLVHAGHQQDLRLLVSARKSGWHTPPGGPTNPSPAPSPASRPYFGDRTGGTGLAIKRSRILTHEFRSGGQQRPRYPRTRFAARSRRALAAVRRQVTGGSQRQQDPRRQEPQVPDPAVPAQRGSVDGSRRVDDAREDEGAQQHAQTAVSDKQRAHSRGSHWRGNDRPHGRASASASRPPTAFASAISTASGPPRRASWSTYPPIVLTRARNAGFRVNVGRRCGRRGIRRRFRLRRADQT